MLTTSDNVLISTACLGGILHNGTDAIKDKFITFLANNKHRCFLEIQHHNDVDGEQGRYNQYLYELSKKIGVPLIAGTDTHALNEEHLKGRKTLQKAKNVRFENEDSWDLTFKTYDELILEYQKQNVLPMNVVLDAIENSRKTTLDRFIYSLSIPLIGRSVSKDIAKYCHDSIDEFTFIMENTSLEFATINGIGISATT